jgi:hypothetical protein
VVTSSAPFGADSARRPADSGWIARRLVGSLEGTDAEQHRQVYRAIGALSGDAVARLGSPRTDTEQGPLDLAVLQELLNVGALDHAAGLGEVLLADRARRFGGDHPQTLIAVDLVLDIHHRLDDQQLTELLDRNERLTASVGAALGSAHRATRAAAVNLSRFRSLWARRRQFGGGPR